MTQITKQELEAIWDGLPPSQQSKDHFEKAIQRSSGLKLNLYGIRGGWNITSNVYGEHFLLPFNIPAQA